MRASVVIASTNSEQMLARCAEAIRAQCQEVELLVIRDPALSVPALRAQGLAAASGEWVALTEDCCVPSEGWLVALERAHLAGAAVVAGEVRNSAASSRLDWAVFLFDYASASTISGVNVSFTRGALLALREVWENGWIEFEVDGALRARSIAVRGEPEAKVVHEKRYAAGPTLRHFFYGGRYYGGQLRKSLQGVELGARCLFAALLPVYLPLRAGLRTFTRGRDVRQYILSFPWFVALSCAWAAGELAGMVAGPGKSLSNWR